MNASEAVAKTIAWYKAFYRNPDDVIQFTQDQIRDFFDV